MLSQSTNSRGEKSRRGCGGGELARRGPTLLGSPSLAPTLLLHSLVPGSPCGECVCGRWVGRTAGGRWLPALPHLPLMLIACGQPGVCLCVSALHLALSLSRSLQLNPFQTRGALSRHHDEAESEATGPAAGPSPPSHTPTPATLTLTHTQPLEPPHKQPEFDSGVGAWGSVWGGWTWLCW